MFLFSDPQALGQFTVAADGTITINLPAGVSGQHRIAVYRLDGGLLGWDSITITGSPLKQNSVRPLGQTGVNTSLVLVVGGILLLAGVTLAVIRRRTAVR